MENFLNICHLKRDECVKSIFGIRQRAILDITLDCNYQWCKAATHFPADEDEIKTQRQPLKLEHSSIRRWTIAHYCFTH